MSEPKEELEEQEKKQGREQRKALLKEKLSKLAMYFRDESVPMYIRVGILIVISLILTFPFWVNLGKDKRNNKFITSSSFPEGGSGLAENSKKEDLAAAALVEYEEKTKKLSAKEQEEQEKKSKVEKHLNSKNQDKQVNLSKKDTSKKNTVEKNAVKGITTAKKNSTSAFKAFPIHMLHPRAIKKGPNNSVWVADKSGIFTFANGKLSKGKLILNNDIYDKEFNSDLPDLSSIHPAKDGSLWAGFKDGTLMRYHRYEWEYLKGKNRSSEAAITSFVEDEKNLFVGSKALYHWEKERLLSNPDFKDRWVNTMSYKKEFGLLLASGTSLYKHTNNKWKLFFRASKKDKTINVISFDKDSILLGTWSGIIRLSEKGVILDRLLSKENVKSIATSSKNSLWAGTRGKGLRYFDGDAWYGAKKEQGLGDWATEIFIDNNIIWLGVTGAGLFLANEEKAKEWISQFPDVSVEEKPLVFRNGCEAAKSLLKDINFSNQVSTRKIDDKQYVFFKGHQICPKGKGYYRNDNSLVLLDEWTIRLFKDNKRTEIPIEKDYPADQIDSILYDSSNSIWIHSKQESLTRYKDSKWQNLELLTNNPVNSTLEDQEQKIWFGTSPEFDKDNKSYRGKSLHAFLEKESVVSWESFDSKNGLIQNSILAMNINTEGKIAIGTRAGISVVNKDKEVLNYGKNINLKRTHITDLIIDKKERIWLSHQYFSKGITWIEDDKIYILDKDLFNDKISKIAFDRAGRLWMLASNGQVGVYPKNYLYEKARVKAFNKKALRARRLDREN